MEIQHEKELDYRTTFERILSGRYEKIHVTGWDEVDEIEKKNPFALFDMISGKRTSTTSTTAQQRKTISSPKK